MNQINTIYEYYLKQPNVVTDVRKLEPGCLFFALRGEDFDGNQLALQAIQGGAGLAIVEEDLGLPEGKFVKVDDVLTTLQQLATHHRRQFNIPVLAIAGSYGKTTTKELLGRLLASHYPTHFTSGSTNNLVGVLLTLLAIPPKTEIAVIEMGANRQGEIDLLCRIAEPTHGLITNVGMAHLEGKNDLEEEKKTKSELCRYLAERNGLVFINQDEPHLSGLAEGNRLKLFYLQSDHPDPANVPFEVRLVAEEPYVEVAFLSEKGELVHARSNLKGRHNFSNIMTALVVGKYFKVPAEKIAATIESYIAITPDHS